MHSCVILHDQIIVGMIKTPIICLKAAGHIFGKCCVRAGRRYIQLSTLFPWLNHMETNSLRINPCTHFYTRTQTCVERDPCKQFQLLGSNSSLWLFMTERLRYDGTFLAWFWTLTSFASWSQKVLRPLVDTGSYWCHHKYYQLLCTNLYQLCQL